MSTPPLPSFLASRVEFARAFLRDRNGRPWTVRDYQRDSLESRARRKVHCSGRDVGKTAEIEIMAAWASMVLPNKSMLIATQHEAHIAPLMRRLQNLFENNPALSSNVLAIRATPAWHFTFKNGFEIHGRIAGKDGINFQGMHVDFQIVDEAQNMEDESWNQIYPALNGEGFRWIYGVPNGLRNQFYHLSRNPQYEQHHWPSTLNPEYTPAKDAEMLYLYNGKDSPGYIHNILGLHGSPENNVFNMQKFADCVHHDIPFIDTILTPNDELPETLPFEDEPGPFYLGCDLGFAQDPSELVLYRAENYLITNFARIQLRHVDYALQQHIIQLLDSRYRFTRIGIDTGHSGLAVIHNLCTLGIEWPARIFPVNFGGYIQFNDDTDFLKIPRSTKERLTELLYRRISERSIRFPDIPERALQYAGHTCYTNPCGRLIYSKGNDHIIDADRCAIAAINADLWNTDIRPLITNLIYFFQRE